MGATVFYLLMLQKYINSKQNRNISGDFSANNMKKKGLNGCVHNFSVDYRPFGSSNIIDIPIYLMKKT